MEISQITYYIHMYIIIINKENVFTLYLYILQTRMMQLAPRPEARYQNIAQAFRTIAATESPRVLFRGIGVVATGAGPAHAMYFSLYEISKKSLSNNYNGFLSQGIQSHLHMLCIIIYCTCVCRWSCCHSNLGT